MANWNYTTVRISIENEEDGKSLLSNIESQFKNETEWDDNKIVTLEIPDNEELGRVDMWYWYDTKWIVEKNENWKWELILPLVKKYFPSIDFVVELYKFCGRRNLSCSYSTEQIEGSSWKLSISKDIMEHTYYVFVNDESEEGYYEEPKTETFTIE